jgi:hypothetical protein
MKFVALIVSAALASAALAETPPAEKPPAEKAPPLETVWTKTKVMVCEVLRVENCRTGGCAIAPKLPSFRIDVQRQTMCGIVSGGCKFELKIGQIGLDRTGTRMTVHTLGAAFVVGIDADGTMNGADVVKGRVVAIQGRCVPG